MANGLDMVVPYVGDPDPTLPYASSIDARINPGSLILFEPSHSYLPWPAGVPATGVTRPNVAWESAAALVGAGDVSSLALPVTLNAPVNASTLVMQRTSKGALHAIVSASARAYATGRFGWPDLVRNWLTSASGSPAGRARPVASFLWVLPTRVAPVAGNLFDQMFNDATGAATAYLTRMSAANALGAQRIAYSAPAGWTSVPNATPGNNVGGLYLGNADGYNSLNHENGRSTIEYSWHLVDVLASGMTFAQLDTVDAAAFAEAFGPGGRFFGDTWNDPATVIAT